MGEFGIMKFFGTHRCNALCTLLDLKHVDGGAASGSGKSSTATTATSAVEMMKTHHLEKRQAERDIDTAEMKRAVKRGSKQPGAAPGTVKHSFANVMVVTGAGRDSGSGQAGITAYRSAGFAPVSLFRSAGGGGAPKSVGFGDLDAIGGR